VNRKLVKYSLKSKYIQLELEDVESDFDGYLKDFNLFFERFVPKKEEPQKVDDVGEYWVNEETGEVKSEEPDIHQPPQPEIKQKKADTKYKKLYKTISIKAHPDRGGTNEDFQKLKSAYDRDNLIEMVELAAKYDIDYEIDVEDEALLEKNITQYQMKIADLKKSMAWVWATAQSKEVKIGIIKQVEAQIGYEIPLEEINNILQ
jgi:hypothetical protein